MKGGRDGAAMMVVKRRAQSGGHWEDVGRVQWSVRREWVGVLLPTEGVRRVVCPCVHLCVRVPVCVRSSLCWGVALTWWSSSGRHEVCGATITGLSVVTGWMVMLA